MVRGDELDFEGNNGGDTSPVEMEAPMGGDLSSSNTRMGISSKAVDDVLYSDIGINVLLNRLKQSIASVRDFATFLKKRSGLEEDHAQGLKKLAKATYDAARRHDARQGSYSLQLADMSRAHERMADHGIQFALSLHQMHEDLTELSNTMERGRKHWKSEGLNNEKKVKDAESAMDKSKSRYDSLAEDYDRARTGDKSSGRVFTVKGPKSAEKYEEDLLRKLQGADSEYASKVQAAQGQRQENLSSSRPQAIRAMQELIRECDAGLTLQMQKFATYNEKLLVGNGMIITPLKSPDGDDVVTGPSMRGMVQQIDNERDFQTFVTSHLNTVPSKPAELRYEKHPLLAPPPQPKQSFPALEKQPQTPQAKAPLSQPQSQTQQQPPTQRQVQPQHVTPSPQTSSPITPSTAYGYQASREQPTPDRSFRGPPSQQSQQYPPVVPSATNAPYPAQAFPSGPGQQTSQQYPPKQEHQSNHQQAPSVSQGSVPQYSAIQQQPQTRQEPPPQQYSQQPPTQQYSRSQPPPQQQPAQQRPSQQYGAVPTNGTYQPRDMQSSGPPPKPVFGLTLDALFRRDDSAVPMVVYQCIQAVDLFGLDTEGIYRLSGNAAHIHQLKTLFDQDASRVDFRNPENFKHDVNSVAGLLKQFFRDLPDPLLTTEFYGDFIDAARSDDDIVRRDSLHAVINSLPDPNYATLRALVLHLNRVQERSQSNRMNTSNLAICFAPTMMGQHTGPHMADAGLQARVIDTILQNTYQIFDED